MLLHVHYSAAELHALILQSKSLLQAGFAWQQDPSVRPDHAMPRQFARASEGPDYLSRSSFESRGGCYAAVREHFPTRDPMHDPMDLFKHFRPEDHLSCVNYPRRWPSPPSRRAIREP